MVFVSCAMLPTPGSKSRGRAQFSSRSKPNFVPGRTFQSWRISIAKPWSGPRCAWSNVPKARPVSFPLRLSSMNEASDPLPHHLPAPYLLLERTIDEYGYVAVEGNYYEVPGSAEETSRCCATPASGSMPGSSPCDRVCPAGVGGEEPTLPRPRTAAALSPRNRKLSSQEEEKRLRAIDPVIGAYVDFILGTPACCATSSCAACGRFTNGGARPCSGSPSHGLTVIHHPPGDPRTHRAAAPG